MLQGYIFFDKMLKNLPKGLFYIIKKEYLCAMFLQCVHIALCVQQRQRKSQQQMSGARVCK